MIDEIAKNEDFLLKLDAMQGAVPYPAFTDGATVLFNTFYLHDDLASSENEVLLNDDGSSIDLSEGWVDGQWEHRVKIVSANNYDRLWIAAQYGDRFGQTVRLKVRDKYTITVYAPATMGCDGDDIEAYVFTLDNIPAVAFLGEDMFIGTPAVDPVTGTPIASSNGLTPPISPNALVPYDIRAWTHADDSRIPAGATWYGVITSKYNGSTSPNHPGSYSAPLEILLNSNFDGDDINIDCGATHEGQAAEGVDSTEINCPTPSPSPSPSPSLSPSPSASPPVDCCGVYEGVFTPGTHACGCGFSHFGVNIRGTEAAAMADCVIEAAAIGAANGGCCGRYWVEQIAPALFQLVVCCNNP